MIKQVPPLDAPRVPPRVFDGTDGHADDQRLHLELPWEYCGQRPSRLGPASVPAMPADDAPIMADAGDVRYHPETDRIDLSGEVIIERGSQRVESEQLTYDRRTGEVEAADGLLMRFPGFNVSGRQARMDLENNRGRIWGAHYRMWGRANARGHADEMIVDNARLTRYRNVTYTTCRPGYNAWTLRSADLELDQESGVGTAKHASLAVGKVPILYLPYLRFPIDDRRKSGFLIPSAGYSDEHGLDLTLPYYWNIAPQMDATFYPRILSERGLLLGAEYRYLTRHQSGTIFGEIIPDDAKYQGDTSTRGAAAVEQDGRWGRWSTQVDAGYASDDTYLEDFGNNIDASSVRRIRRFARGTYAGQGWSAQLTTLGYQTVDPDVRLRSRPYARLPQLLLNFTPRTGPAGLRFDGNLEYDYFHHDHRVHGNRLTLAPEVSLPLRRSYGHLIPSLTLNASAYDLRDRCINLAGSALTTCESQSDRPSHLIPTFDLDGRLIFERRMSWLGRSAMQTLEPRLFYLYTPFEDQSETPVFDSSELTFSYLSLFRNNRFTGRDRIGDANQLTLGISSRTLLSATGNELFRASIGQIYYFADRQVQIVGPTETTKTSAVAAELAARLSRNWSARASFQWDPNLDEEQWQKHSLALHYRTPDAQRILNLAYRLDRGALANERYEDTDLSFRLPAGDDWVFVGRWLYSIEQQETVDAFAGIEYGRCCWRIRVVGRSFKSNADDEPRSSILLQLELNGLASLGNSIDSFLEDGIYGYHVD